MDQSELGISISNLEKNVLDQLVNNISQFVWWKDLDSVFIGCNENLLQFLELKTTEEIVGKTDFDFVSREEAENFRSNDRKIIATGTPQINFEEILTLPNTGKRWLSTSKFPLYDDHKKIIGTVGWFNDITEFKTMQIKINENNKALFEYSQRLEETNRALEIANIDLEKFTFAASHDLKAPIQTMGSFAMLLKSLEGQKLEKKSIEYIDYICDSAERATRLIDNILIYARTGSTTMAPKKADIRDIVVNKMSDLKSIIDSKGAVIHLNLPAKKINCFPSLIGLTFFNLLSNALKFNLSDPPVITCSYSEGKDHWIFFVEDNGIGINHDERDSIFKLFTRGAEGNFQGSGIGLSICTRVTSIHKGEIWIEKAANGNTVFKFSVSKHLS